MDQEPNLKADDPRQIRAEIQSTRCSLTGKLESLEHEVKENMRNVTDTVVGTVETVKHTVEDTVDHVRDQFRDTVGSVKAQLDVTRHVQNYPWCALGTSVAAGFLAARLLPRDHPIVIHHQAAPERIAATPAAIARTNGISREAPQTPGIVHEVMERLEPEINKLKGLAIGAVFGLVRNWVKTAAPPSMTSQLQDVVNDVTVKLGGQPLPESSAGYQTRY